MDEKFPVREEELAFLDATLSRARMSAAKWRAVCDQLTRLAGGVGTVLVPVGSDLSRQSLTSSESLHSALRAYRSEAWFQSDPRQELGDVVVERGYGFDTDIYPVGTLEKLPFYADFLRRHGLGGLCGVHFTVGASNWYAAIQFAAGRFTARSGFVDSIPRVRAALSEAASEMMDASVAQWQLIEEASAALGSIVLPLDAKGRLCEDLLAVGPHSFSENEIDYLPNEIVGTMSDDLNRWLKSKSELPPPPRIYHGKDKQYFAGVFHSPPELMKFFALNVAGILSVSKTQGNVNEVPNFAEKNGLTPAEVRVLKGLCAGDHLKLIAEKQNLKEGTVRQQLKSVFRKTNTSTQHQLVAMVYQGG